MLYLSKIAIDWLGIGIPGAEKKPGFPGFGPVPSPRTFWGLGLQECLAGNRSLIT